MFIEYEIVELINGLNKDWYCEVIEVGVLLRRGWRFELEKERFEEMGEIGGGFEEMGGIGDGFEIGRIDGFGVFN